MHGKPTCSESREKRRTRWREKGREREREIIREGESERWRETEKKEAAREKSVGVVVLYANSNILENL